MRNKEKQIFSLILIILSLLSMFYSFGSLCGSFLPYVDPTEELLIIQQKQIKIYTYLLILSTCSFYFAIFLFIKGLKKKL